MTEPRIQEQRSSHDLGPGGPPSVATCRQALAFHGQRENFRTVTITFDTAEEAARFDDNAAAHGPRFALTLAPNARAELG